MATTVIVTDQFEAWWDNLDSKDSKAVAHVVGLLEQYGVLLSEQYSKGLVTSKYSVMRELRVQSQGRPLRVAYAFDPKRQAVLLLGGDKTGKDRFYASFVREADTLWAEYLADPA